MDDKEQASKLVRGQIHLDLRDGDTSIGEKELGQFDLFRRMKKSIPIGKFPGSIVLRRYGKGDVIFQQGQAGGTAFYIPTAEDLVRLSALQAGQEPPVAPVVDPNRNRQVLAALIIPSTSRPQPRGFFAGWFSSKKKGGSEQQAAIPSDGPSDIDYATREAPLMEGDLFGEMSCISYMPRSATVIARIDCQLVEFNRNVFDQLRGDANHQAAVEKEYRRRTLETHLRQFELFRDLSESQIQLLKEQVSLEAVPPGKVICEEGEQWSDDAPLDVFIVRNGVVQVMINAHLSVRTQDVRDWTALCRLLEDSQPDPKAPEVPVAAKPASPLDKLRQMGSAVKPAAVSPSVAPESAGTPSKLSPMDQIRAKQAAAAAREASGPADPAEPPKKLSPIEQMRAKQAAAAASEDKGTSTEPAGTASAADPDPATAPKKLSPIELIRAKQAAAAATTAEKAPSAEPATAEDTTSPAEPVAPKKLSPIELIRAKQAAAAAATAENVPSTEPATVDEAASLAELVAPKKLSPIEQMRAKQAAAKATPAEPASELVIPMTDGPVVPETPPKKLSPIELMRAKQANSGSTPVVAAPAPVVVKNVPRLRKPKADQMGSPVYLVKSWFNDPVLQAVHQLATGALQGTAAAEAQDLVTAALNELSGDPDFLGDKRLIADIYVKPELMRKTASFPKGFRGIAKDWSELELRTAGRTVLSEIFPGLILRPTESSGPPRVLAYLSRGDCIGEIVVVKRGRRNATCIAYNHPSTENPRDFGNVELVRIPGSAFRKLLEESPQLKQRVEALAEQRISQVQSLESRYTEPELIASTEFQQMGLFQGTRLLVIDLDSCTRCGDCVQACVATHDDGASRLFLDGPRYDRFLVPSACRNCLNPVCMIGCPVGSIGRGENSQIEIYDWCIGCSACADQCPYDSIQMHDIGLIPEESPGWLYANRRSLPDDWFSARRLGAGWMQGQSPFRCQGDLLRNLASANPAGGGDQAIRLCFRHEFRLPKSLSQRFRISINDDRRKGAVEKMRVKKSKVVDVWLNGACLEWSGNSIDLTRDQFSRTNNVLAIEVELNGSPEYGQFVLSACLDAIPEIGASTLEVLGKDVRIEMDLVTRRAAVCDLCSHLPSQQPACVSSCPHDAAIRINPLVNFPI
ncbi:MAG: cyclic nucleotide-binding domain-containing protein [Planctomycetes bacterium]|nr:cyclic nucleotide-binding domain-containing protein [Planctomycetota bacterium]